MISAARCGQPAVVAVIGDDLVGMAAAQLQGERAWISMVALSSHWRNRGIGSALLGELEIRLRTMGVRRISALLPADATGAAALHNSGYTERTELSYFEKVDHVGAADAGLLANLGGQVMPGGLWQAMAGMEAEKQIIEQRIVLPLVEPNAAAQYGVSPPKAVILFGPPGTGKTSFAKAVAGRLGWPFVELFPSRLAAPDVAMASALREAFATLMELEAARGVHRRSGGDRRLPVRGSLRSRTRCDQRTAEADSGVSPARRTPAGLCDELGAIARFGVLAAGQVRLHHPGRSAGYRGPRRDLESVSRADDGSR